MVDGNGSTPTTPRDEELNRLLLDVEKAKARKELAQATQDALAARSSVEALVPDLKDAPTGVVTLGDHAGALADWLTHQQVDTAAAAIAKSVKDAVLPKDKDAVLPKDKELREAETVGRVTEELGEGQNAGEVTQPAGAGAPVRPEQPRESPARSTAPSPGHGHSPKPRVLVLDDISLLQSDWIRRDVQTRLEVQTQQLTSLTTLLARARNRLTATMARLHSDEEGRAEPTHRRREEREGLVQPGVESQEAGAGQDKQPAADSGAAKKATETEQPRGTSGGGPLGAAVSLLGLLSTDYSLSAVDVATSSSELATITAGQLAKVGVGVERDGFGVVGDSQILKTYKHLLQRVSLVRAAVESLDGSLSSSQSEVLDLQSRSARLETQWAEARTKDGADANGLDVLRREIDTLAARIARRQDAVGPAKSMSDYAHGVLVDTQTMIADLLASSSGGRPQLLTAIARERINRAAGDQSPITHVLAVELITTGADAVTRRSILGTSGRIGFIGSISTSWLLLDAAQSTIAAGGAKGAAHQITYDISTGGTAGLSISESTGNLSRDPLLKLEFWAKLAVMGMVAVLFILSVTGLVAVLPFSPG